MSGVIDLPQQKPLVGRTHERRALDLLLDAVRDGRSGALVVRGEPGIGKTALLEHLKDRATGCEVVTASAVQSEMELAFAGLHQLSAPLLDRVGRLPAPQRTALATAFGQTEGPAPDRFMLGLAVLRLLGQVAGERPVVCLVDDAQWLDRPSSQVLSFVARRLVAEPVALVFAAREPGAWLAGLPVMSVQSLSDTDARALLLSAMPGPLDEPVAARMVAEANGNPVTLLQSARRLTPTQLAGGFGDPGAGLMTSVPEEMARQLAVLPDETRLLLLVAATEPVGDPLLLWRAVERLGIPPDAADAALSAGLLEIGSGVRFRHPAVRSAVYRSAARADVRRAHGALAAVTDPRTDPERAAWHRAYAACKPDEALGAELERSAGGAAMRGGLPAKWSFLSNSAALTSDPVRRARRTLTAAETVWQAGDAETALRALAGAEAGPLDHVGHARAELLRARVAFASGADDAARRLFDVARRLEPLDIDLAHEAYLDALRATIHLGTTAECDLREVARCALAAQRAGTPRPTDLLLDAIARQVTEGHAAAAPALRRALRAFVDDATSTTVGSDGVWLVSHVASLLGQHDVQKKLAQRHALAARNSGAFAVQLQALTLLVEIHLREGQLAEADALVRELHTAANAAGSEPPAHPSMLIAAYRGRDDEGRRLISAARAHTSSDAGRGGAVAVAFAELLLNNGLGRYEDAVRDGRHILEEFEPLGLATWALPELVEAAVRAGAVQEGTAALRRLAEKARISGTAWALGLEARCRALLTDGPDAEHLYLDAIARLDNPGSRVDLARAHLVYGEWLRRAGRRVDARQQLRTARDMLSDMGVEAFAERARRELRATGETARKRVIETRDDLTPQEEEIARLARDGLSNPEIGARLFISPRTVEWHLRKIFVKLGIRSRVVLRDALPERTEAAA